MTLDLCTFLTALYTIMDDLYKERYAHLKLRCPGRRPSLSDSEILTLAIFSQWFGMSERGFIRYARENLRGYFPILPSQSAFNRRVRNMTGLLIDLAPLVARELGAGSAAYEAIDTVPVPLMRRCRGKRRRLFGVEADIGRGGSDRDWYYGCKLLLSATPEGAVAGFLLGPANTEDRWMAESFFCWRKNPLAEPFGVEDLPAKRGNGKRYVGPTGPIRPRTGAGSPIGSDRPYLGDNGFFGADWQARWRESYGATALTPKNYAGGDVEEAKERHSSLKQVVETVNGQLTDVFGLRFPGARSAWGLVARVATKLAALNMGILLNRRFHRPDLALDTLFSR